MAIRAGQALDNNLSSISVNLFCQKALPISFIPTIITVLVKAYQVHRTCIHAEKEQTKLHACVPWAMSLAQQPTERTHRPGRQWIHHCGGIRLPIVAAERTVHVSRPEKLSSRKGGPPCERTLSAAGDSCASLRSSEN